MANPVAHLALWRAITQYGGLSLSEKSILLAICCYGDDTGQGAWPGIETLSHDCCCNRRTVLHALKSLQEKGLIKQDGRIARRTKWVISTEKFFNQEELAKLANRKPRPAPPRPDAQPPAGAGQNGNGPPAGDGAEGIVYVNGRPHQPYKPKGLPPGLPPVRYRTAEETAEEKWRRTQEQIRRYNEREAQKGN